MIVQSIPSLLSILFLAIAAQAADVDGVIMMADPVAPAVSPIATPPTQTFRTPAKQYGSAYSIKLQVFRGDFNWIVPVWVKPDQEVSTFDAGLMGLMGWAEKEFNFDDVRLSTFAIAKKKFAQAKSDWAYFPDFSKSCCVGVIGQDILKEYQVVFDPRPPTHLVWSRVIDPNQSVKTVKQIAGLAGLFSLHSTLYQKRDLTDIPYTLNLAEGKLIFDDSVKPSQPSRNSKVFQYEFLPPVRNVRILSIQSDVAASANKVGLKIGAVVTMLNRDSIGKLDRIELDQILTGKRKGRITLTLSTNKEIDFDFKKNEFTTTESVPSRSR